MSKFNFGSFATAKPIELAILAVAAAGALYVIVKTLTQAGGAAANTALAAGGAVVGAGVGIATGNNVVTAGTPYEGTGIFGTLGAATNDILGGAPAALGNWFSGTFGADTYDPNADTGQSSSIQSSSGNPFGAGTSSGYGDAANSASVPATATASAFADDGTASSW